MGDARWRLFACHGWENGRLRLKRKLVGYFGHEIFEILDKGIRMGDRNNKNRSKEWK